MNRRIAYHVTTFLEKGGGMVTILAFEQPLPDELAGTQGNWMGRHWRFARGIPGKSILLLGDNARALARDGAPAEERLNGMAESRGISALQDDGTEDTKEEP